MRVVLASGSPRRRELCEKMGLSFEVRPVDCDEAYDRAALSPREAVSMLARRKCAAAEAGGEETIVIASDTMVEIDGLPLGKPRDADDARRMLRRLSGRTHTVHTGVAVRRGGTTLYTVDSARVRFWPLGEAQIDEYVRGGEPMDKAGSYAVQGKGGAFVAEIIGAADTVIGLCCAETAALIKRLVPEAGVTEGGARF
ncbi:MAG: septum formation protein Maf [Clostridia bacterium]|nr:septum formation protein Maf [Clostridia bacterium]